MALRVQGLFTEYLTRAKRWVAAANSKWGTDVKITSVALDSEKFAFANSHHAGGPARLGGQFDKEEQPRV